MSHVVPVLARGYVNVNPADAVVPEPAEVAQSLGKARPRPVRDETMTADNPFIR